jgi:hypothetical protein
MRQSSAAIGPLHSAHLSFASRMSDFAVAIGSKADNPAVDSRVSHSLLQATSRPYSAALASRSAWARGPQSVAPPDVLPALAGTSNRNGSKVWTLRSSCSEQTVRAKLRRYCPKGTFHGVKSNLPVDNSSKFSKLFLRVRKFTQNFARVGECKNLARGFSIS